MDEPSGPSRLDLREPQTSDNTVHSSFARRAYRKVAAVAITWELDTKVPPKDLLRKLGQRYKPQRDDREIARSRRRRDEIARFKAFFSSTPARTLAHEQCSFDHLEIPSSGVSLDDPTKWITSEVERFLKRNHGPDTLVVFYYGGHAGLEKDPKKPYSELKLAGGQPGRAGICSVTLQNQFLEHNTDLLMIMDCCSAAALPINPCGWLPSTARQDPQLKAPLPRADQIADHIKRFWELLDSRPWRTEILAACGINTLAMEPGYLSFTASLMTILEKASKDQDWISTHDLHRRVLLGEGSSMGFLPATPILMTKGTHKSSQDISLSHISLSLAKAADGTATHSNSDLEKIHDETLAKPADDTSSSSNNEPKKRHSWIHRQKRTSQTAGRGLREQPLSLGAQLRLGRGFTWPMFHDQ